MDEIISEKFFFLQHIEEYLLQIGLAQGIADLVTFIAACTIMALLVWLINFIGTKMMLGVIHIAVKRSKTLWDDFLLKRKFFSHLMQFIAIMLILASIKVVFSGYDMGLIAALQIIARMTLVLIGSLIISSFLNAANDIYESKPIAKQKSIRSYIQTGKIIIFVIAGILIIAILLRQDPTKLLVGLGASAAVMTLVFKDTILGFIASIQISAQDMLRPGDWIEMPSKNADGIVTEINVNSIKVKNWNNTITSVPIYSLVSESFTNWRSMEESEGRRFKRPILIDIHSVCMMSGSQIESITSNQYIAPLSDKMLELLSISNTSDFSTNIGLLRCYIEAYLMTHPHIAKELPLVVRFLPPNENGISIELYGFSSKKDLLDFERVVSDIFEHIIAIAPLFSIRLYERPTATPTPTPTV